MSYFRVSLILNFFINSYSPLWYPIAYLHILQQKPTAQFTNKFMNKANQSKNKAVILNLFQDLTFHMSFPTRLGIQIFTFSFLIFFFCFTQYSISKSATITFPSKDGLTITADTYMVNPDKKTPFIILFHQAGWSRGEYGEIAPKLNKLGFNCMAVDLRSGGSVNGVQNETTVQAQKQGKPVNYTDAEQDIISSIEYARKNFAKGKLIAWGSSYSAALVLKITGDNPNLIDGVISFAPGEYFKRLGKSPTWIQDSAKNITVPVFITSGKNEYNNWAPIYGVINTDSKTYYLPDTKGNHGSRALWDKFFDSPGYWKAVNEFLQKNFQS